MKFLILRPDASILWTAAKVTDWAIPFSHCVNERRLEGRGQQRTSSPKLSRMTDLRGIQSDVLELSSVIAVFSELIGESHQLNQAIIEKWVR
jgi:hypothetical protein